MRHRARGTLHSRKLITDLVHRPSLQSVSKRISPVAGGEALQFVARRPAVRFRRNASILIFKTDASRKNCS